MGSGAAGLLRAGCNTTCNACSSGTQQGGSCCRLLAVTLHHQGQQVVQQAGQPALASSQRPPGNCCSPRRCSSIAYHYSARRLHARLLDGQRPVHCTWHCTAHTPAVAPVCRRRQSILQLSTHRHCGAAHRARTQACVQQQCRSISWMYSAGARQADAGWPLCQATNSCRRGHWAAPPPLPPPLTAQGRQAGAPGRQQPLLPASQSDGEQWGQPW